MVMESAHEIAMMAEKSFGEVRHRQPDHFNDSHGKCSGERSSTLQ